MSTVSRGSPAGSDADRPEGEDRRKSERLNRRERISSALEPGNLALFEADATGTVLFMSDEIEEILGSPAADFIDENVFSRLHPIDVGPSAAWFNAAIRNPHIDQPGVDTIRMSTSEGDWRFLRITIRSYLDPLGEVRVIGSLYDVTGKPDAKRRLERQLAFGSRVADICLRLMRADAEQFESTLHAAIAEVGESTGVDRITLYEFSDVEVREPNALEWNRGQREIATPPVETRKPGRFRWSMKKLARGEVLLIERTSDLPIEAAQESAFLQSRNVRSLLGIPVLPSEKLDGYITFESTESERTWTGEEIEPLRVVASLFVAEIRRRRAEASSARQIYEQRQIAEFAREFAQLDSSEIDDGIVRALGAVARIAGSDRASLLATLGPRARPKPYAWCRPGIEEGIADTSPELVHQYQWFKEQNAKNDVLQIDCVEDLPIEAALERAHLDARGVRSLLGFAIRDGARLLGYLLFEWVESVKRCSPREVMQLRLVSGVFTNALRRKRAEDALARSQLELVQAQKMEVVGQMAGGIAHDFNNLLTVILGNAESLVRRLPGDVDAHREAEDIHDASLRAAELTRQLLAFSRPQMAAARAVDLNQILMSVHRMLARLISENVELDMQLCDEPAIVFADASQLEQIVVNLVVNAASALKDGGRIEVGTRVARLDASRTPGVSKTVEAGSEAIVLSVADDGCGMDDRVCAHIFEPFFTTREPGQGSGLGLSIVYNIVRQAGGFIDVDSALGVGTRFEIHLPRTTRSAARSPVRTNGRLTATGRVLLVEDEASVRRLTRRILEGSGHTVFEARNGVEALERIDSEGLTIDLLLTDVVMPKMGGAELSRRLLERRPDLPVIFMSGYHGHHELSASHGLASPTLLLKPFAGPTLLEKVAETLSERREPR